MKSKRILLAIENPHALSASAEAIRKAGHTVTLSRSAREALSHAGKGQFDLAVIDCALPEMDGVSFTHILKAAENTRNLPVALICLAGDESTRKEGLEAGVSAFLEKPVDERELLKVVGAPPSELMAAEPPPGKIMVVEDSPIICKAYKIILEKYGYDYHIQQDSNAAIEAIRSYMPDLILMDANMPGLDGYDLTKMIKAEPALESIRIIMVTADTKKQSILKALEAGVVDFLTKPFDEEVLLARMRTHLNNKRLFDDLAAAYHELKTLKDKLELLSITDGLTGLFNHRHFHERLVAELGICSTGGAPVSLILFDIDHFKKFNDTYGHKAGDAVLRAVADVIRDVAGEKGIAARYGGEEFAIILPGATVEKAAPVAETLREKTQARQVEFNGATLTVTISLGVAMWDGKMADNRFIELADKALYKSKEEGRNRVTIA
ncbi:MAG: diguanylate cyclase [Nitrospinae bacterium]|nr:diguanylate cyclase [Nitrospinota bacterium]